MKSWLRKSKKAPGPGREGDPSGSAPAWVLYFRKGGDKVVMSNANIAKEFRRPIHWYRFYTDKAYSNGRIPVV